MTEYDDIRTAVDRAEAVYDRAIAEFADALGVKDDQIAALTAEVVDLETALAACQDEEPTPTGPLLGAAWKNNEALPTPVKSIDFFRFFFDPNDLESPQTWGVGKAGKLKEAYDKYGCRTFSISFKPGGPSNSVTAAAQRNIAAFLDSAPPGVDILVTFYHEHDGNIKDGSLTVAQYVAGSKIVAGIAESKGRGFGPIHNGNVYNGTKWGLWPAVWKANGDDALKDLYTFWGTDCYSPNYEAPSPRMDPIKTYADSLGLPVLIGEMASPYDDAAKQTDWATKARAWALENVGWASWWSSQTDKAGSTNFRLREQSARNWFGLQ